jgi:hypothetical protein
VSARRAIGIDLGTTHSALASVELGDDRAGELPPSASPEVRVFEVPQLVSRGSVAARALLPSFVYFAHSSEGALGVPWDASRTYAVGEYARSRGVEAPNRLVSSAKSWLSHTGIDRRAGVLPAGAPEDVEKISPVEASFRYLDHLAEAWAHATGEPLSEQEVVLTVPASFDAAARDLTVEAAYAAGLENVTLLEEPQAALYAWLEARGEAWRKDLRVGDVILVVDIGGGTTDFSAIAVLERDGSLELHRVAVGDHILLGGDNMDLALAHGARQKLAANGQELDRWQVAALTHGCRVAKERLLGTEDVNEVPIVVPGRGSQLLGGSIRTVLTREEVRTLLLDGFFPEVPGSARPAIRTRAALTQVGLPYAADPGITRHLAAFLGRQAQALNTLQGFAGGGALLRPSCVLFNGGVVKATAVRERLVSVLNAWLEADGAPPARVLPGDDPDLAVARGAAYYGRVRHGRGLRIRGGTARAYYVGIESAMPAIPGLEPPISALCVAPFGMEEGTEASLPAQELGLVVGEPVRFRFFGSTVRRQDVAGVELESWTPDSLEELAPIEVTLPAEGRAEGDVVPIHLRSSITPVGTLLLEAVPTAPLHKDERWKIELSVRGEG